MSIETVVYEFALIESLAIGNAALYGALVHADCYEEIKGTSGKWIRVDDLLQSIPIPPAGHDAGESNAVLDVQFVVRPETQTPDGRRDARILATQMANEFAALVRLRPALRDATDTVCDCLVTGKRNEWRKVGNLRHAVSFLRLKINS